MKPVYISLALTVIMLYAICFFCAKPKVATNQKPHEVRGNSETGNDRYRKPDGSLYSAQELLDTWKKIQQMPTDVTERSANAWNFVGPDHILTSQSQLYYSGRVRSLELVTPLDNNDVGLRIGSASGGIWKMQTLLISAYGQSMQGNLPTLAIGATATNPLDSRIMLAGTGEPYGVYRGMGIFKTYNGGQTWAPVTWDYTAQPSAVMKILYVPGDTTRVFAATSSGLYSSTDGGNTWHNQLITLYGVTTDLACDPQHPDTMYTAISRSGLYRTVDGGINWSPLNSGPFGFGVASIAVANSSPNILFAVCDSQSEHTMGIYKSTDYGNTWLACPYTNSQSQTGFDFHWGQGNYNNCISIKPTNPNIVLVGAGSLLRSTDGWNFMEGPNWNSDGHHDNHAMVWRPDGSAVYLGNDGGLFSSTDDGFSFSGTMNILPISQFYKFDINPANPNYIIAAAQDNSIPCFNGINWNMRCGGDGWSCAFNYDNVSEVRACYNDRIAYSTDETQTFSDYPPPTNQAIGQSSTVRYEHSATLTVPYYDKPYLNVGHNLYSQDPINGWGRVNPYGQFSSNIVDYAISYRNNTADLNNIYFSLAGNSASKIWKRDRTTGNMVDITHGLPSDTVNWYKVFASPYHFDEAYAVRGWGSEIYKTTDAGNTNWAQIPTGALPQGVVINTLFVNPYNSNEIYIGTLGWGVFKTVTNGVQWARWENGMPAGMDISDFHMIDSFSTAGKIFLYASSYGRGIWKRELSGNDPGASIEQTKTSVFELDAFTSCMNTGAIPVHYRSGAEADISIGIFDISGKQVAGMTAKKQASGEYAETINAPNLGSGIYICALFANGTPVASRKLVVIR